jgi:hypothetical protein
MITTVSSCKRTGRTRISGLALALKFKGKRLMG